MDSILPIEKIPLAEDLFCAIDFEVATSISTDEPDRWVSTISGKVLAYSEEHEDGELVAKSRHFYVDLDSAIDHRESWMDVLDCQQATTPFIELYNLDTWEFTDEVLQVLDEDHLWSMNLLIADRIEVLPKFRGKGVPGAIHDEVIRLFRASACLYAFKAFPLQLESGFDPKNQSDWETMMLMGEFELDQEKAHYSLRRYYRKQGYLQVGSDGLMVQLI